MCAIGGIPGEISRGGVGESGPWRDSSARLPAKSRLLVSLSLSLSPPD